MSDNVACVDYASFYRAAGFGYSGADDFRTRFYRACAVSNDASYDVMTVKAQQMFVRAQLSVVR